ncbi:JmjC domain-containing protein [Pendulispora albinea]|uniref:Cupin domain-containing protein n=1 Tax=Pendulispora albinea TaxID=2741071 RepID=A0ABZ2LZH6_9BACT
MDDRLSFSSWFEPLDFHEFRKRIMGESPLFVPPRAALAERLKRDLDVHSADDLLKLRDPMVKVWFHQLDGLHGAVQQKPADARRFYDAGMALYFQELAEFREFEAEVAAALGVPAPFVKCQFFCNRAHARTLVHFDSMDNVIVQLTGSKTWRLGPNTFAPAPLRNWTPLDPVAPEMRPYAPGAPPKDVDTTVSYTMEPGALLHVPRGYWHETVSEEESVSVHVVVTPPIWLDVVVRALIGELARDERWRRSDYGIGLDDPSSRERAGELLASLREKVAQWVPEDIVVPRVQPSAVHENTRFVRCARVTFATESVDPENAMARVTVLSHEYPMATTTMAPRDMRLPWVDACRWVNERATGTSFDASDLRRAVPAITLAEAQEVLGVLEGARLVRRRKGP